MMFRSLGLAPALCARLAERGWEHPTPIQEQAIPGILAGRDVLGCAPTGTGKSAAFLLPGLSWMLEGTSRFWSMLVLEPTRELANQVAVQARELSANLPLSISLLSGGTPYGARTLEQRRLVIATAGRLGEYLDRGWLRSADIDLFVIDEADRMLDLGFAQEVKRVAHNVRPDCQTLLFSATLAGSAVRSFAQEVLHAPLEITLGDGIGHLPAMLRSKAYLVRSEVQKFALLNQLLLSSRDKTIIFVKSRDKAIQLGARLRTAAERRQVLSTLHGDLGQRSRNMALRRFAASADGILVATDLAARGMDIQGVSAVYNYDLPQSPITYIHRAGRTARAGQGGSVISLLLRDELAQLCRIERHTGRPIMRAALSGISEVFPQNETQPARRCHSRKSRSAKGKAAAVAAGRAARGRLRLRDRKNSGRPDFERKKARRHARHNPTDSN